jgi:hypothetical protein
MEFDFGIQLHGVREDVHNMCPAKNAALAANDGGASLLTGVHHRNRGPILFPIQVFSDGKSYQLQAIVFELLGPSQLFISVGHGWFLGVK